MSVAVRGVPQIGRRPLVLLAILGVHALLIGALLEGFAQHLLPAGPPVTETRFIELPRPERVAAQLPQTPGLRTITLKRLEPPKLPPLQPPPADARTTTAAQGAPPEAGAQTQRAPSAASLELIGRNRLPNSEDFYPATARRLNQEGAARVHVCVDERGSITGAPQLTGSSGHRLLDEAALAIVRAGQYARAVRGGLPVGNCYNFQIDFQMHGE